MAGGDCPSVIDRAIGERIRRRRVELGLTQEQLARRVGISYQQIQKYERGANRISASRLFELAVWLDVTPGYLYPAPPTAPEELAHGGRERPTIEIARSYGRIEDEAVRAALSGLVRAVADRRNGDARTLD